MPTKRELLALAANTENLIAKTSQPDAFQLSQRDRIIAAAHAAGITDAEISAARQARQ
ncbi:hypothetical protein [Streptomyces canus]|uniref:hypothetical protein n=1 Tax=Streptomyces canus TaxID=58343 RepID=UPI002780A581|nr:hypothetical protein [Streptomyces canus]MDQ0758718.1 hypothetical protein [Streptomyces canus]